MASVSATVFLEVAQCRVYRVKGGGDDDADLLAEGELQMILVEGAGPSKGDITFCRVGATQWPLDKKVVSIRMSKGLYVFILPVKGNPTFYRVALPDKCEVIIETAWEEALEQYTKFRIRTLDGKGGHGAPKSASAYDGMSQEESLARQIADALLAGAQFIGTGVVASADMANSGMHSGTQYFRQNTQPLPEPMKISESTRAAVTQGKLMSGMAIQVSAGVVAGAVAMTDNLAFSIGGSYKQSSMGSEYISEGNEKYVRAAKVVGAAGLEAVGELYRALDSASRTLIRGGLVAASDVIDHRYGSEAGAAARDTAKAVTNLSEAALNMNLVSSTALAQSVGRKAAVVAISGPAPAPSLVEGPPPG